MILNSKVVKGKTINTLDLEKAVYEKQTITLIKNIRDFAGIELKSAKDLICNIMNSDLIVYNKKIQMINLFTSYAERNIKKGEEITEDEFINLVNSAVKNRHIYRLGLMESLKLFINNVEKDGGLSVIAEERETFLENL